MCAVVRKGLFYLVWKRGRKTATIIYFYVKNTIETCTNYLNVKTTLCVFLISNIRPLLNVVFFPLGDSPASERYVHRYITFRRRGITQRKEYNSVFSPQNVGIFVRSVFPHHLQLILPLDTHYEMASVTAIHRVICYKGVEFFKMT